MVLHAQVLQQRRTCPCRGGGHAAAGAAAAGLPGARPPGSQPRPAAADARPLVHRQRRSTSLQVVDALQLHASHCLHPVQYNRVSLSFCCVLTPWCTYSVPHCCPLSAVCCNMQQQFIWCTCAGMLWSICWRVMTGVSPATARPPGWPPSWACSSPPLPKGKGTAKLSGCT